MLENKLLENIDQDIQYYTDQVRDMTKRFNQKWIQMTFICKIRCQLLKKYNATFP